MLPDLVPSSAGTVSPSRLNAPTGAWCSLTEKFYAENEEVNTSQCTYRCVVLPDWDAAQAADEAKCLNAPTGAWCSLTSPPSSAPSSAACLNAPTGAWCSLT